MLKKLSLAMVGMAVSGLAVAGTMGPACTPGDVTVPCESKMWDVGVQALYLQSVYDADKAYGFTANSTNYKEIDNEWDWGYRLEGSYHFSTGNDITIDWLHFSSDSHTDHLLGGFVLNVPVPVIFTEEFNMKHENRFDQVNAVMGQVTNFGLLKSARFYGGMQYAAIRDNQNQIFSLPPLIQALTHGIVRNVNATFYGFGPVVGVDYAYYLNPSFSILAKGAASVLYGSSRYSDVTHLVVGLTTQTNYASTRSVVPSMEGKLGANYSMNLAQGTLNVEGGYYAVNYFNALQSLNNRAFVVDTDFGLYGPYVGVKWVGNA